MKKNLIFFTTLILALFLLSSCSLTDKNIQSDYNETSKAISNNDNTNILVFDNSKWEYDSDNNIYYQLGITYCSNPDSEKYEKMAIYVPGNYMNAIENGDGYYTCSINNDKKVGSYTAKTAPIVLPVNTPGYMAQTPPSTYNSNGLLEYLDQGFIYLFIGMRGRSNEYNDTGDLLASGGAPWGVTDLKAGIRYYRFNSMLLPGDSSSIFSFGMSGGGAQSALIGSTGDSDLYLPYLNKIGAAIYDKNNNYISDSILGSMCWCPITSLDIANEAYEWNLGQFFSNGSRNSDSWESQLSKDLSTNFATYINDIDLKDESGLSLMLEKSENGIYQNGTYYNYIIKTIETSLNNFLADTTFPYTKNNDFKASGNFGGGGDMNNNDNGVKGSGNFEFPPKDESFNRMEPPINSSPETYNSAEEYINTLNGDSPFITYDKESNSAKITNLANFITTCKIATKDVGAFDSINKNQGENQLFGTADYDYLHFDKVMAQLIEKNYEKYSSFSDWDPTLIDSFLQDIAINDSIGISMDTRVAMYNPMYYLNSYYEGYESSNIAKYWRIRTGINQGDTALTTEINLALALKNYSDEIQVDFETVWGMYHTLAERTGDSTTNFIQWVENCMKDN